MTSLSKKIFITGATHGIGKATAELFCSKAWEVYGISSDNKDTRGQSMMAENKSFHHQVIDVRDEQKIAEYLNSIGPIDAAFNNAGIGKIPEKPQEENISAVKDVLEVNLLGTIICMKHELKNMQKGTIINNASISAIKAKTGADAAYCASKAGILRLTAEAAACADYVSNIKFFSLLPGYINTRMTAADNKEEMLKKLPHKRIGEPTEVAELVYQIIENNYAFTSGQCFNIDEGAFLI